MRNLDLAFRNRDINGLGLTKHNLNDVRKNKIDNSPFDTNSILYNGGITAANTVFIDTGTGVWTAGNASIVVPVISGHRVRIEGREFSPNALRNVWLKSGTSTTGDIADFAFSNFSSSSFIGDGDYIVPEGATHLYVLFYSNVTASTIITDLDADNPSSFLLKYAGIPNSMKGKIDAYYADYVAQLGYRRLILLRNTYVAVGIDSHLYYNSQMTLPDSAQTHFITAQTSNSSVIRTNKGIKYAPTASAANFTVSYALRDTFSRVVASFSKNIITVPRTGGTGTKNIMFLGSSTNEIGIVPYEVCRKLVEDGFTINAVGTRNTTAAPSIVKTEGRSGWTWSNYVNDNSVGGVTNAFRKNNALNFSAYLTDNNLTKPDIVFIALGINDVAGFATEQSNITLSATIALMQTFMSAMQNAWSGTKIILTLPYAGAITIPVAGTITEIRALNIAKLARLMVDNFDENRYSSRVYLSDCNQMVDRIEGHSYTTLYPSSRLSSVTERLYTDYTHPSYSGVAGQGQGGFYQMGDGAYSIIRALI